MSKKPKKLKVAQLKLTLHAQDDGDLILNVQVPDDDKTPYMTRLGMLEMAKTMIGEIK